MVAKFCVLPWMTTHFWEGLVPAAITLCAEDKVVAEDLCPCYVSLQRLDYLGTALKDVIEHFWGGVLSQVFRPNEIWFDCGGEPLNW